MRPLRKREALLLRALLVLGIVFGLMLAVHLLMGWRAKLIAENTLMRGDLEQAQVWLADREMWRERGKWLQEKTPQFRSSGEASSALLNRVQKAAQSQKVTLKEQNLMEPGAKTEISAALLQVTSSASMEGIIRWLAEIQQPLHFIAIPEFTLKMESDGGIMQAQVRFNQFYGSTP